MKIPRDVSGTHLADTLCRRWRYTKVHQVGSHIILETSEPTHQRISIPEHDPAGSGRSFQSSGPSPSTKAWHATPSSRPCRPSEKESRLPVTYPANGPIPLSESRTKIGRASCRARV